MQIHTEITGLRELSKELGAKKESFARSALRTALRNAAKPVLKAAKGPRTRR